MLLYRIVVINSTLLLNRTLLLNNKWLLNSIVLSSSTVISSNTVISNNAMLLVKTGSFHSKVQSEISVLCNKLTLYKVELILELFVLHGILCYFEDTSYCAKYLWSKFPVCNIFCCSHVCNWRELYSWSWSLVTRWEDRLDWGIQEGSDMGTALVVNNIALQYRRERCSNSTSSRYTALALGIQQ